MKYTNNEFWVKTKKLGNNKFCKNSMIYEIIKNKIN
jgi:hypothetical protein